MTNTIFNPDSPILFSYRNHRGETANRQLIIEDLSFNANPGFGYQPGWFLSGYDLDKKARRSFALTNMVAPETGIDRRDWAKNPIWYLFRMTRIDK